MTTTMQRISLVDMATWGFRLILVAFASLTIWLLVSRLRLNFTSFSLVVSLGLLVAAMATVRRKARERFIAYAEMPHHLKLKLRQKYPQLSGAEAEIAEQGLRDYFLACLQHKNRYMAMPSQAVDVLWHEFILHTNAYDAWCDQALGYFLHHTPAEALGKSAKRNDGLRRIWHWACKREAIDPRKPERLPFLFAIDHRLHIPDGFHYAPDCRFLSGKLDDQKNGGCGGGGYAYCGTSFSDGSYSGSSGDFGGAESSSDGSSGSSSDADGGGGCGGGGGD